MPVDADANRSAAAVEAGYIVVIDDDPDVRVGLHELLSDSGYQVVSTSGANDALLKMCSGPRPGLVLVDVLMPGMNAWELIAQMKRREKLADVPIVAITGSPPNVPCPVPNDLCLRKPVDPPRLLALVERLVSAS